MSSKFSFDQMVLAREKALSSQDKSPTNPVEPKKPGFKYSASSTQLFKTSTPVVCKKQEVVAGDNNNNKTAVGNNDNNNKTVVGNNNNNNKTVVGNNNNKEVVVGNNNKPRSRSSSVESSSWEYYTETEPEDSD